MANEVVLKVRPEIDLDGLEAEALEALAEKLLPYIRRALLRDARRGRVTGL